MSGFDCLMMLLPRLAMREREREGGKRIVCFKVLLSGENGPSGEGVFNKRLSGCFIRGHYLGKVY